MHPQHPWMMRVNAEEMQRDIERQMRLKQARRSADRISLGFAGGVRRAIGLALIAIGGRIQPEPRPAQGHDSDIALELAR